MLSILSRPLSFEGVVGQPAIVKEMLSRRNSKNWPQAMLFRGSTGVGKTTVAKIVSMTINCRSLDSLGNPCCKCPSCLSIMEERFDRDTHQLDGGESSKKEVIDFSAIADIAPMYDENAIFIIEESDQLSISAKNSLLKTLEKPRNNVYFILLSMYNTGLPPAIQGRCQKFIFNSFTSKDIVIGLRKVMELNNLWLSPNIPQEFYLKGLPAIADIAMGSFRDAIQSLEKCIIGEYWTPELMRKNLGVVDIPSVYEAINKLLSLDSSVLYDLDSLDIQEFINLSYYTLSQAAAYKFTKIAVNDFYEEQTRAISQNKNLFDLLKVFDEIQLYPFLKKGVVISKLSQYYNQKKSKRIEE